MISTLTMSFGSRRIAFRKFSAAAADSPESRSANAKLRIISRSDGRAASASARYRVARPGLPAL